MKKLTGTLLSVAVCASLASAVQFEAPKDTSSFDGVEVNFGANLTFNYQSLENTYGTPTSSDYKTDQVLQAGMILPTADLDINAKLFSGFNVYFKEMLSSHHHHESYAEGGYATVDNLDFITPGFASSFMDNATIKMGVYMPDIGDDHFSRSTNGEVMNNPFINNKAIDLYMDAPFAEVLYRMPSTHTFVVAGLTSGVVNPTNVTDGANKESYMYYGKVGYDNQLSDALRVRATESVAYVNDTNKDSLFSGDKGGDMAAQLFGTGSKENRTSGVSPFGFDSLAVSDTNLFVQLNKTEFTGNYKYANGSDAGTPVELKDYSVQLLQRFGMNDRFYAAARYENTQINADSTATPAVSGTQKVTQTQLSLGWFLSKNAMAKLEYIDQKRENMVVSSAPAGEASFKGYMIQAALSF